MNIENQIEVSYRELEEIGFNDEFENLYKEIENIKFKKIISTLHYRFTDLFKIMNTKLPTYDFEEHFWAEESRELLLIINITNELYDEVKGSEFDFEIDEYYNDVIKKCEGFLSKSGGSTLPSNMQRIKLYYTQPIFKMSACINVKRNNTNVSYALKQIGEGSYANVYKYKDDFYNCYFVVKRAKKNLSEKELSRFKREFEEMKALSYPYIVKVFCYNEEKNEYIMEYMDYTLETYILKNNSTLTIIQRKNLAQQVLRAFKYIHSKGRLHRDISPKNILIKEYEDVLVIKVSDFGLVKIPSSNLTTVNTEFKGYFNDPALILSGFDKYNCLHETYALTRILYYIMTGKTNTKSVENTKLKEFVEKGLNDDERKRFQNVDEMIQAFKNILSDNIFKG